MVREQCRLLTFPLLSLLVASLAATSACGGSSGSVEQQTVVLREWAVTKSLPEVPAGKVKFRVRNNGSLEHELVIIRTDLDADNLPVDDASSSVEIDAAGDLSGHIVGFAGSSEKSATFNLTPGKYVLICNIAGHFQQGMRTDFTVQ